VVWSGTQVSCRAWRTLSVARSHLLVAIGVVEIDFEHDAGDALGEGVVVSAFGVGVGR